MGDRAPILPPRPPIRLLLWAAANARWFRVRSTLSRALRTALRRGRRALAPREPIAVHALAGAGRASLELDPWMFGHVSSPRGDGATSERPTVVHVRRMS